MAERTEQEEEARRGRMFTPSASAGQEGCLTSRAEQGCEDQSLEIPSQTGDNRIKH